MLTISSRVDYGVQLLQALARARRRSAPVPLQPLARQLRLPYRFLAQIARQLCRAGLLESFEGVNGGYRLSRHPSKVNLGEVVAALEPQRRLVRCLREHRLCPHHGRCGMRMWWQKLDRRLSRELQSITLAQLIA